MRYQIAFLIMVLGGSLFSCDSKEYAMSGSRPDKFQLIDTYGDIPFAEEKLHLDNFGEVVIAAPETRAFVVIYGGKGDDAKTVKCRACRALRYLLEEKHCNPATLTAVIIYGEHCEELTTELWRTPIEFDGDSPHDHSDVPKNELGIIKGTEVSGVCSAVSGSCK